MVAGATEEAKQNRLKPAENNRITFFAQTAREAWQQQALPYRAFPEHQNEPPVAQSPCLVREQAQCLHHPGSASPVLTISETQETNPSPHFPGANKKRFWESPNAMLFGSQILDQNLGQSASRKRRPSPARQPNPQQQENIPKQFPSQSTASRHRVTDTTLTLTKPEISPSISNQHD